MPVADCSLGHLRDQRLRVAQQQNLHPAVAMELVLQLLAGQPVSMAGALYDRAARGGFTAHEQRDADETLVAHHRDLRRCAVFHHVQQRHDAVDRKIDVAQDIARLVQEPCRAASQRAAGAGRGDCAPPMTSPRASDCVVDREDQAIKRIRSRDEANSP